MGDVWMIVEGGVGWWLSRFFFGVFGGGWDDGL